MFLDIKKSTLMQIKYLSILTIGMIAIGINLYLFEKKHMDIHKKFMICAIFLGGILIFAIPVLHGIDEGAHFFKVYSLVCGSEEVYNEENKLIDKIPNSILQADSVNKYVETIGLKNKKIDTNDYMLGDDYIGAKLYSMISYIPYILPMFICQKILQMDIVGVIYIGRIFAFICWLLISAYTIKIIPKRKEFISFLCLMPIVLTLVTTYTGDLVTNSVILLFLAYWYKLYFEKRLITKKEIVIISILGIISACSKLVYAMIFFILFLLPIECFKNKKHKIKVLTLILSSIIIATFINLTIVGSDLIDAYPKINLQKEYILSNLGKYIWIFVSTIVKNFWTYVYQFSTGRTTMCQNSIMVNDVISVIYIVLLALSIILENAKIDLNKNDRILISIIVFAIIIIIFTSLYLQWTATNYGVGYEAICGVQGRYFIPIVALFILANTNATYNFDRNNLWTGVLLINIIIICKIIIAF